MLCFVRDVCLYGSWNTVLVLNAGSCVAAALCVEEMEVFVPCNCCACFTCTNCLLLSLLLLESQVSGSIPLVVVVVVVVGVGVVVIVVVAVVIVVIVVLESCVTSFFLFSLFYLCAYMCECVPIKLNIRSTFYNIPLSDVDIIEFNGESIYHFRFTCSQYSVLIQC